MGDYRIVIEGSGPHGCDRGAKQGATLAPSPSCTHAGCPDCAAAALVKQLGTQVRSAKFTHWPRQTSEVVDDLAGRVREKGQF